MLKDPHERDKTKEPSLTEIRRELKVVPKPWAKSYHTSANIISQTLYVTNPTLRQVLSLWYRLYSPVRLIDTRGLVKYPEAIELAVYQGAVMKEIDTIRGLLLKK